MAPAHPRRSATERSPLRVLSLVVAALAGAAILYRVVDEHQAVAQWLIWRYLAVWGLAVAFAVSTLSAGLGILSRVLRSTLPLAEHLCIAFALGVYAWFLGSFVAGVLGLFGPVFFVLLPLALFAVGARQSFRFTRRLSRHVRAARKRARPLPWWAFPVLAFGALGLLLVYVPILTPENVAFDSRWQHLGLAEQYAAQGGIERTPEGWYVATSPHLAATLYSWPMQWPASRLFDRVMLAAHVEWVCFLFTLVGIAALVKRVLGRRVRFAWVARFLFPGVFLYDSSLALGADHVAAVFAAPIFVLALHALRDPSARWLSLLAVALAGAVMTKYTSALLLVAAPLAAVVVASFARLRRPAARRSVLVGLATATVVGLAVTAPHWLKNWVWHGDPLYPLLHAHLTPRPWTVDSAVRFQKGFVEAELWRPEASWSGLLESLKVTLTHSFVPNDWPAFHGKRPVMGSLLTLSLLLLPFVRAPRRLWGLVATIHVGIVIWYWLHHQDRYLQAAMPWMAAATLAILALAWSRAWIVKGAVGVLVGFSIVWGADVPFIPGHAMVGSPFKASIDLFASGYQRKTDDVLRPFRGATEIAKLLPADARVLLHEHRPRLGLRVPVIEDIPNNQGGISYGRLQPGRGIHDLLHDLGVTHVMWQPNVSFATDSLAGDLVFFHYVTMGARDQRQVGRFAIARLPERAPPVVSTEVLVLACRGFEVPSGIYALGDLTLPPYRFDPPLSPPSPLRAVPADPVALRRELSRVGFAVVDTPCQNSALVREGGFQLMARRKKAELWLAKP